MQPIVHEIEYTMKVTQTDFQFMVESLERDMATILVQEQGMTIHQALDNIYQSPLYDKLHNPSTGLYFQSPRYVLSILTQLITPSSLQPR